VQVSLGAEHRRIRRRPGAVSSSPTRTVPDEVLPLQVLSAHVQHGFDVVLGRVQEREAGGASPGSRAHASAARVRRSNARAIFAGPTV
jgi:hypothetical protein